MIVLKENDRFRLIFQRAHAQLAAFIAYSIAPEYYPTSIPFSDLHTAIADHDDGRQNWQGSLHINEKGYPIDYKEQPLRLQLEQATKTVEKATYKSPWIGLLISMHQVSLYEPFSKDNEAVQAFLEAQREIQHKSIKLLNIDEPTAIQSYEFMRFCDEFSLILCEERLLSGLGPLKPGNLGMQEIFISYDVAKGVFQSDPWCFKENKVSMSIFSYPVRSRKFTDDQDLIKEINTNTPILSSWNFSLH